MIELRPAGPPLPRMGVHKFGANTEAGTTAEDVWDVGGTYTYQAAAAVAKISSSDANDAAAGTGARTIEVQGLDSDWALAAETVTMNGQTAVNTSTSWNRIFRLKVLTAGSGNTNAGDIYAGTGTVTAGVPATKYAKMQIGNAQTLMCMWTVPSPGRARLLSWTLSTSKNAAVTFDLFARPTGSVFQLKARQFIFKDVSQSAFQFPPVFDAKTDLVVRATASAGTANVSAQMDLELF